MDFPDTGSGGWNHRVITRIQKYGKSNKRRIFEIIEVYYDKEGNPSSYVNSKDHLSLWENLEDLKGTYEYIASAFTKPIIDLDNFPEEWKDE